MNNGFPANPAVRKKGEPVWEPHEMLGDFSVAGAPM